MPISNSVSSQVLTAVNRFVGLSHGDPSSLNTIVDVSAALQKHGVTHELISFVHMFYVVRVCPMARAFAPEMKLDNPFHGYVLWYHTLDVLCFCTKKFAFPIPGLSTTDAVGTGLSSCDKVSLLATEKKAEMTAAMEARGFTEPNMDNWFYRPPGEAAVASTPLLEAPATDYLPDDCDGQPRASSGEASSSSVTTPDSASRGERR
jgi:hypothetical protein